MWTRQLTAPLAAAIALGLLTAAPGYAAGPEPAEILKEIDATKPPTLDREKVKDKEYVQEYLKKSREAREKRADLILELYKADPSHERLAELLPERWRGMTVGLKAKELAKEIDEVIATTKNEKLRTEGVYTKAVLAVRSGADLLPAIEEFLKIAPKDERGASLLAMAARAADEKDRDALEDRLLKLFPDSRSARYILGGRRQRESIGKPFELEFTDAVTGKKVSMKDLRGKVVVIDFWATWCGPCVAEMPNMKKLYAEYKDKGVEFIGVSLDQPEDAGGLEALKKFVKEKEIPWPQYYQGKGWDSEFSTSWGINAIPSLFIIDTEGKLHSTKARGKLEELIPELLKKGAEVSGG
ncbi:MAG TPA: TlpA disulfide reductase family protein [Gemmataceae bacterium]